MLKSVRILYRLLFLGLLSLSLGITIPAMAQSYSTPKPIVEPTRRNIELMNQGQAAYQIGRYQDAADIWHQLARQYQKQGNVLMSASTLNYLSLAHQELGQWNRARKEINRSLRLLQHAKLAASNSTLLGQVFNTQGSLELATGNPEKALLTWQQATSQYQTAQDLIGIIGSKVNQAQALQALGLHRRSQKLLEEVRQELSQKSDPQIKIKVLQSLGATLQTIGDIEQSQAVLQESLEIAQEHDLLMEIAGIYFGLGNAARLQGNYSQSILLYQKALTNNLQPLARVESQLNLLTSLIATEQEKETEQLLPEIKASIVSLVPSRPTIYTKVNFAKNLIRLKANKHQIEIERLLKDSLIQAQALKDVRAESTVWGALGHYHEQQQQWSLAQSDTENALKLAEVIDAKDIAYQWQWQLGRLLKAQDKKELAIASYTASVDNLQFLRSSLIAINSNVQFSFRESVEPVYRELVELLLDVNPSQHRLQLARQVIESLQLAELENFFQEACLDAKPKQIDEVDSAAAVIYPIVLSDRIAVILSLPDRSLKSYSTYLSQAQTNHILENLALHN